MHQILHFGQLPTLRLNRRLVITAAALQEYEVRKRPISTYEHQKTMLNANHDNELNHQLEASKNRYATFPLPEYWVKSALLKEFVNLFQDAEIQAMLLESQMQVMERGTFRWVSVIAYYDHLGKRVEDCIHENSKYWADFRDLTGVIEVEIFTCPFTDPKKCLTRVDLKVLRGWNDSPVKYGIQPALI